MAEILRSVNASENAEVLHAEKVLEKNKSPTIIFLGGGMGAGKSSVVDLLIRRKEGIFGSHPVVIEADALKMRDPIFQALNKVENGSNVVSQIVHGHSTDAANSQLLLALREQRNIVMDGTMTWMPYVKQTIDMVRDCHFNSYRLGPGYQVDENGTVTEKYWQVVEPASKTYLTDSIVRVSKDADSAKEFIRRPYKIEMVGVTVDPEKAVARGLRRKLITNRGVPVTGQLRSHRLFSENFESYLDLLDKGTLFDTSCRGDPDRVALKETGHPLLSESFAYNKFLRKRNIVDDATCVADMYDDDGDGILFSRDGISQRLKDTLLSTGKNRD